MHDRIEPTFDGNALNNIGLDQRELLIRSEVRNVLMPAAREVIDRNDLIASGQ